MGFKANVATIVFFWAVLIFPLVGRGAELRGASDDIDEHALFRVVGAMYDLDPELLEAVAKSNPQALQMQCLPRARSASCN